MKVLHVSTWKIRCGIAACTQSLVEQLDVRGVESQVFPIVPHDIRTMVDGDLTNLFGDIAREARNHDLVHIQHEFAFFSSPHARSSFRNFGRLLGMLKNTGRPVIATFHTEPHFPVSLPLSKDRLRLSVLGRLWRWHVSRYFRGGRSAAHALIHNRKGRQSLVNSGFDRQNIIVVPMGHEPREIPSDAATRRAAKARLGLSEDTVLLSMFGFIGSYKGHAVAVKALKTLPKNYVLAIIGGRHPDAGDDATLNNIIRMWRKQDPHRLLITGYADRDTIDVYQAATDICLAPYLSTFSLSASGAVTWAITSGRPTIASGIPAFEEINRKGQCLLTVTPGGADELAWSIKRLVGDEALQTRLVQNADAYARANSWSVAADHNLRAYQQVLSRRGGSYLVDIPAQHVANASSAFTTRIARQRVSGSEKKPVA
jgi:glycosyltransferase involved in cell wall biosynthesis